MLWNFVSKVMSLLFNMLSRFVTTLLPRSKCLLISWQKSSAVILEFYISFSVVKYIHIFCNSCFRSSIFPSIRIFSSQSVLHIRWPKYWSFSFSISPSNEYSRLISFRIDWLDLFAVQGTLRSLLQHHSSKASILWCSAFFIVQLSHPYMTTGKTIALTRWTLLAK